MPLLEMFLGLQVIALAIFDAILIHILAEIDAAAMAKEEREQKQRARRAAVEAVAIREEERKKEACLTLAR